MRLLNTTNLTLSEFFKNNIPPYAILSHRWGDSEVTFQDLLRDAEKWLRGWVKIMGCCHQVKEDGFEFVASHQDEIF